MEASSRTATKIVCAFALSAATLAAHASAGPFGGSIFALRADPTDATRVYASTSNGFFRSDDGGATWAVKESGLLAPHPANGVFAVAGGDLFLFDDGGNFYHSTTAGDAWTATGFVAASTTYLGGYNAVAGGGGTTVWFAANQNGLLVSHDGGATFAAASGTGFPASTSFTSVSTDPANPQHVIAGAMSSCDANGACPIYTSTDGGSTWTLASITGSLSEPSFFQHVFAVTYASGTVYALYEDPNREECATTCQFAASVLASTDNGLTWTAHTFLSSHPSASIAATTASSNTVWVDANKSTDGGATFAPASTNGRTTNGVLVPNTSAVALGASYPSTPQVWVGTPFAGVYASTNDGGTWSSSDNGMTASDIRSVIVHPADSGTVYAAYGDSITDPSQALFRTDASGDWILSNTQLNAYQLRTVMIDPTTATTVAGTTMFAVGNGFDTSGSTYSPPFVFNGGIYKSTNGGSTWTSQNGGLPAYTGFGGSGYFAGDLRTIIADPRSCTGSSGPTGAICTSGPLQTLYVTGAGRVHGDGTHPYRVMKSIDGGTTWNDSSTGLPNDIINPDGSEDLVGGVTPIVIDPTDSRVLYIGTYSEAFDAMGNSTTPTSASGVYKSIDSGATWTWSSTGLPTYGGTLAGAAPGGTAVLDTLSLAIDPSNRQTLWVSTKDIDLNYGMPGQIFKSTNGGANWTVSNAGVTGPDVRALLVDASNPGTIYAASGGVDAADPGGVYKSTDGGTTWRSISVGLPASSATALTLDPHNSAILYAGTSGGVYSLVQLPDSDGDGVPDAIEDAGANGGDANHDGIPDRNEPDVASVPTALAGSYGWQPGIPSASARSAVAPVGSSSFVLQAAPISSGDCKQTVDVSPIDPATTGSDTDPHHGTYTYPNGVIHFELPQCAAALVDVTYSSATFGPGWSWRYYGPSTPGDASTLGWHDATSLVVSRVGTDWQIKLNNGQFGSYRPAAADSILFVGGPAYTDTVFRDGFQ